MIFLKFVFDRNIPNNFCIMRSGRTGALKDIIARVFLMFYGMKYATFLSTRIRDILHFNP